VALTEPSSVFQRPRMNTNTGDHCDSSLDQYLVNYSMTKTSA
jgi:hypothetical protein